MTTIQKFEPSTIDMIRITLSEQMLRLSQIDLPPSERSISAKNFGSAINALGDYMQGKDSPLPTKALLEQWRDDMIAGRVTNADGKPCATATINARLSAARKLLNAVASEVVDVTVKMSLRDWANVESAKAEVIQDKLEEDYGRRLTLESAQELMDSIPVDHIKGLRDRAIIALGLGAGLRVSEISRLTLKDVFSTVFNGATGIHVRNSKHGKTRVVVMGNWNHWVFETVGAYTLAIGLDAIRNKDDLVFRGVKPLKNGYKSQGESITDRAIMAIFEPPNPYMANYQGEMVTLNLHDLRRTYAYLCRRAGMSWEAIAMNMGHSDFRTTMRYVGTDMPVEERVAQWGLKVR